MLLPIPAPLPPPSIPSSLLHRVPSQQLTAAVASRPTHCHPCPSADVAPVDGFQPSSAAELPAITAEHGAIGGAELWQQRPALASDTCRCRVSLPGSLDITNLHESQVLAWLKRADGLVVAREASLPRGRLANDLERAVPPQPKGAAASSARCRTFVVSGKRRDLNESVRKAAVRLGMCEYGSRPGNWFDFELRDPPDEEDTPKRFVRRKRGCISGYIPGLRDALGTKTALARLRAECEGCAFLPPSFEFKWTEDAARLHGPHAALRALSLAQADYPQLWVLKTHDGFSQHEMKLVQVDAADASSDAALDGWLHATVPTKASMSCRDARLPCEKGRGKVSKSHRRWVLQTYVRRPALYRGRKFDLRVWAAITSLDPLRLVLLGHAFPKVSTVAYSPAPEHRRDACMHVRLPVGSGCEISNLVWPYPVTTLLPLFFSGLNLSRPLAPEALAEFWRESVVPELERAVAQTVLYARHDGPLAARDGLLRAGAAHRSVAVLSLDALLDQGGRVHLVDVNTNGNLQGDYSLFNTQRDIEHLLPILGADGFPRKPAYAREAAALLSRCCAHCDAAAWQAAAETLDEEVHAHGTMWYRSFPALLTDAHEVLAGGLPAGLLTEADRALHAFLRCRRESG